jgi:hypothetical protein
LLLLSCNADDLRSDEESGNTQNLLSPSVIDRPLHREAPAIDLGTHAPDGILAARLWPGQHSPAHSRRISSDRRTRQSPRRITFRSSHISRYLHVGLNDTPYLNYLKPAVNGVNRGGGVPLSDEIVRAGINYRIDGVKW